MDVTIDNRPLATEVLVPQARSAISGLVVLDASANGRSDVTEVRFALTGRAGKVVADIPALVIVDGWIARFESGTLVDGPRTLTSTATDAGGRTVGSPGFAVTIDNGGSPGRAGSRGACLVPGQSRVTQDPGPRTPHPSFLDTGPRPVRR